MLIFVALFIATDLAAYDQAELSSLCDIYYSECESTTNCDDACDSNINTATVACNSEVSNHDFAKCFLNYNTDFFTSCTEYRYLALCLFEETKDIDEFSCYNGGTTAVECPSSISDGVDFNLQSIDYDVYSVPRGSEYWTVLTIDFGTFSITSPPDDCVTVGNVTACEINPWLIPHINLHACLMTEQQKTCSCLMLESTELNSTVTFTDTNPVNPSDGPFDMPVSFEFPGTYRLMAHIQFYEDIGNEETIFWDLANAIDLTVIEPDPTNAPTVQPARSGTISGSLTAVIVCLTILACYFLLYIYYKCYYEPQKFIFDEVQYEVEEEDDELASAVKDEDFMNDAFVITGVEETKEE